MKRIFALMIALMAGGCGSMPERHIPSRTGPIGTGEIVSGLSVSIAAASDAVAFGQPVYFELMVSNASDRLFWIPQDPHIIFAWTYSSGRRDNFIGEYPAEQFFTPRDAVKIYPGETIRRQIQIPTGYFPTKGITEFKAIYSSPRNSNPDLRPFWHGEVLSNSYGVDVRKKKYGGR